MAVSPSRRGSLRSGGGPVRDQESRRGSEVCRDQVTTGARARCLDDTAGRQGDGNRIESAQPPATQSGEGRDPNERREEDEEKAAVAPKCVRSLTRSNGRSSVRSTFAHATSHHESAFHSNDP